MVKLASIERFTAFREKKQDSEGKKKGKTVIISSGTCGQACGALKLIDALKQEISKHRLEDKVNLRVTGCHGFCEQEPCLIIEPQNVFYCHIQPQDIAEIVSRTLQQDEIIDRFLYTEPVSGQKIVCEKDIPFYQVQDRTVLGQNKLISPCNIEDYIAQGGYSALIKVLTSMKPEEVVEEIKKSGLRGRGGGGFPTGKKWEFCRRAEGKRKYVVCNADEGDPGAYMDRSVLEGNPHLVIEGMLIGAYAIGADEGYIYVRNEYPLAVKHAKTALQQAEELGLLGENILGTDFSFTVKVARGGGAFVCGESTALMASLEGRVGEPRPKDIHTTDKGFMDLPTTLNNVETWANVPFIINKGSAWFAAKGTAESKGTKIFALTGKITNTGLVEVPMGTTLGEIVYKAGGGSATGKKIKAVQVGGPSGGCFPESLFNLPVDFEALSAAGGMMGSGGMVVMDESTCMVDTARYFLDFLIDESCGKCVPCRIGLSRMRDIIRDITEGKGSMEQLELLQDIAQTVSLASLCALGKTAPNPVLSTIKYFFAEYEAHIKDKRCPAGVCKALIHYSIDMQKCKACGACLKACPHSAVIQEEKIYKIDSAKCRKCGACRDVCRFEAVGV